MSTKRFFQFVASAYEKKKRRTGWGRPVSRFAFGGGLHKGLDVEWGENLQKRACSCKYYLAFCLGKGYHVIVSFQCFCQNLREYSYPAEKQAMLQKLQNNGGVMMMNRRRLISLLLALCLCIGILPVTAHAVGGIPKGSAEYGQLQDFLECFYYGWWLDDQPYDFRDVATEYPASGGRNILQALIGDMSCYAGPVPGLGKFYKEYNWDVSDPLGKWASHNKANGAAVHWILMNVFNCSEKDISKLQSWLTGSSWGEYYLDGYYYSAAEGVGGPAVEIEITEITPYADYYSVIYNVRSTDLSRQLLGRYFALVQWKNTDGLGYWSLYYHRALANGEIPNLPTSANTPSSPTGLFTDVEQSAYYYNAVKWGVEQGIVSGTGVNTFSPNATCTKAQILTFIWRAAGKPEPTVSNPFTDVASSDYYCKPAVWAYEKGMVTGSSFAGGAPCTRSMAVTYLWQAAGSPAVTAPAQFTDVRSGAGYARAVAWAVNNGITNGTGANTFSPDTTCNRGQIVTFLYRCREMDLSAGQPVADSSSVGFYTGQWTYSSGGDERASMRITDVTSNQLSCEVSFYRLMRFEFVGSVDSPGHAKLYDAAAKVRGELILDGGQLVLILEDVPNFYFDSSLSRFLGGARFVFQ